MKPKKKNPQAKTNLRRDISRQLRLSKAVSMQLGYAAYHLGEAARLLEPPKPNKKAKPCQST
jgi:hypothetical protein